MILVLIIAFGIRIWISIGKKESVIKPSKKAKKMYCRPVRFRLLLKNLLLVTLALFLSAVSFCFVLSTSKPNLILHVALFAFSLVFYHMVIYYYMLQARIIRQKLKNRKKCKC